MLDKMRQLKQMHDLQKQIQQERFEAERNGVKVIVNGVFQVEELNLPQNADEKTVKDTVNDALRKAQMGVAQKFRGLM